jgi:hypothetical protein
MTKGKIIVVKEYVIHSFENNCFEWEPITKVYKVEVKS